VSDILLQVTRDRRSLAVQVRDELVRAIHSRELPPGSQLPGEHELAERLSVGRSTVREALRLLQRDGLVDVVRGRGRYVSALARFRADRPITEFESVTEMLAGLGYQVENRVLDVRLEPAGAERAAIFGTEKDDGVVVLERFRTHEDEVLIYSIDVIDARVAPGSVDAADWEGSVLELLRSFGANVVSSAASIEAAELPTRPRRLVPQLAKLPWLRITETCVTDDGRAVLHATDFHRGDIFAFHVVRRRSDAAPDLRPTNRRAR
jgi:GntR family transcriptional regulator